ncbi:flagellar basal-body rod protein FlgC [Edaphobacter acidisoli]|uniref:Flagellar basal-body rod protein FlgC n=1 Tax=Edaphobacter acidisoli TaxID=2040573 RepID=A0A916W0F0_9BACT|nr:flagellar basal body rod protein FlgC [Edaphobacter acidisoli]GGA56303.1 flagellar basal-body rod protein FlgC [Edaphobacter acidisoli]
MNLFGVMDVSASALRAERVRAEVVASNMANAETTRTADGTPYQRHHVVFEEVGGNGSFQQTLASQMGDGLGGLNNGFSSGIQPLGSGLIGGLNSSAVAANGAPGGVAVAGVISDNSAPLRRYDPGNPDAGKDGYVAYPDINPLTEMVDLMGATRSYGMNASAVQAEKNMVSSSLDILKS